jgi:hypothetical protein
MARVTVGHILNIDGGALESLVEAAFFAAGGCGPQSDPIGTTPD